MEASRAGRFGVALSALAGLGILVGAIVLATALGGEDEDSAPLPGRCLQTWNFDPGALNAGRHNFSVHGYTRVQVGLISREGELLPVPGGEGDCVAIFAAEALDPEPPAAALTRRLGAWIALSEFVERERLAELQAGAVEAANARLVRGGRLLALVD